MSSLWAHGRLADLVSPDSGIKSGPFGTSLAAAEYSEGGVPVVSVGEIGNGIFQIRPDTPRVDKNVTSRLAEYVLAKGDIVLGRKGGVDRSAWVAPQQAGWFLGSDGIRVRAHAGVDSRFLAFQLRTRAARAWLRSHAGGSTLLSLNQRTLASLPVVVPPLREQSAIAEVLGALDDKIAANDSLVFGLDRLMDTTFSSLKKDEGLPLSDVAEFVNGRPLTKGASGHGRVVIRIAELNNGISGSTVFSDAEVDDAHVARPGDILFAWSGSLTLHRWFRDEAIVNQHIFKVVPKTGYPSWMVYELLRRKLVDFKSIAADKATTMGHIQRHDLDGLVSVPTRHVVEAVDHLMTSLWNSALLAERSSLTLAATRDALLPGLMSGALRARDVETMAPEAGV